MQNRLPFLFATLFFFAAAFLSRFADISPNFTAVGAVALLSGYYFARSKYAFLMPLGIMLVSDLILGFYHWQVMVAVYASFLVYWGAGRVARASGERLALLPAVLFGSLAHFIITNFAVWAFTGMYEPTTAGLLQSYLLAIPFYKWALFGDMVYLSVICAIVEATRFALISKRSRFSFLLANS